MNNLLRFYLIWSFSLIYYGSSKPVYVLQINILCIVPHYVRINIDGGNGIIRLLLVGLLKIVMQPFNSFYSISSGLYIKHIPLNYDNLLSNECLKILLISFSQLHLS